MRSRKKKKSFTAVCSPQDPLLCVQTAAGRCPHDALLPAVLWNQRGERQINSHSAFFECLSLTLLQSNQNSGSTRWQANRGFMKARTVCAHQQGMDQK